MHKLNILICDDIEHNRIMNSERVTLCSNGMFFPVVSQSASAEEAVNIAQASETAFDLILMDLEFSRVGPSAMNGFEAAEEIHRISPSTIIAIISAYGNDDNFMIADKTPWVARFFQNKTVSRSELLDLCRFALLQKLHNTGDVQPAGDKVFTRAPVMLDYLKKVDWIGADENVIIYGESGTGKELTAKRMNVNAAIAQRQEKRPIVSINCGGLTPTLRESELFGHVKGSFTGAHQDKQGLLEKANGGDVFLDELQNAPLELQDLLMRVLNDKEFTPVGGRVPKKLNVRFITALNKSPTDAKRAGTLKPDLLARLQQNYLVIPALRERKGDIPALVEHLMKLEGIDKTFSDDAIALLESAPWPTNVRGLKNVVLESIRKSKIPVIRAEAIKALDSVKEMFSEEDAEFAPQVQQEAEIVPASGGLGRALEQLKAVWFQSGGSLDEATKAFEKIVLMQLWRQYENLAKVSRRTRIPVTTLRRKLAEYGIAVF